MTRLGALSDTHGKLDPRILTVFSDVDRILHAGDFCVPEVLWELEAMGKPLHAVRGNCDTFPDPNLPDVADFEIEGVRFVLVHNKSFVERSLVPDTDVVVFGHSHMPTITEIDGILWVNPGSASQPRRSRIGPSVALIDIRDKRGVEARIVALDEI